MRRVMIQHSKLENSFSTSLDDLNAREAAVWNSLNYDSNFEACCIRDQPGTFFEDNRLCDSIAHPSLLRVLEYSVEGVNEPAMLYVGTFGSSSAWHMEGNNVFAGLLYALCVLDCVPMSTCICCFNELE